MKGGSEVDSKIDWTAPKDALTIKKDGTSVIVTGKTVVGNFDVKATINLKPVVESVVGVQLSVARNTAAAGIALPAQVTLNMSNARRRLPPLRGIRPRSRRMPWASWVTSRLRALSRARRSRPSAR